MSNLLQKEKLKKMKDHSSNTLIMRRDTTASLKSSYKRRNRNATITSTPISGIYHSSKASRNSNRLKNNSICKNFETENLNRKDKGDVLHRHRINSYCPSPYMSLSMDHESVNKVMKPVVRRANRTNCSSPLNKTLKYLKSKIQPRGISFSSGTRHGSNQRSNRPSTRE